MNTDYEINAIMPVYAQIKSKDKKIVCENEFDMCDSIKKVCARSGKQFIYVYFPEPDSTMHEYGVSSVEAKQKIDSINAQLEKLSSELTDTLLIITADHGQIDVEGFVELYKDDEINAMLEYTPYLDARTPAFRVKKGKEKEFEQLFEKRYGEDFNLFRSSELIKEGYFGYSGDYGYLLGDYIAIGTFTHKLCITHEFQDRFKGHHTSLTEEMEVPLIMIGRK